MGYHCKKDDRADFPNTLSGVANVDIIDRYILKGFVGPFIGCMVGFVIIALSSELYSLMSLIVEKHVKPEVVGRLLMYRLPDMSVVAVPIALLFGVLFVLGRMSRDSELTIVFVSGRSFVRTVLPFIILGASLSSALYYVNEHVVPGANHRAQQLVREFILKDVMPEAKQDLFFRGTGDRFFYLGSLNKGTLEASDVMVFEMKGARPTRMIFASKGKITSGVWRLADGVIHEVGEDGVITSQVRFTDLDYRVEDEISAFVGEQKTAAEMSRAELAHLIELFGSSGIDVRPFRVEYSFKAAVPFACLVFALTGAALSLGARRNGRFYSVAVSVGLAFFYYLASALFKSLGNLGSLSPVVAAWSSNVIFAALGVFVALRGDRAL